MTEIPTRDHQPNKFTALTEVMHRWIERVANAWFHLSLRTKMTAMVMVGLAGLILVFATLGITSVNQATEKILNERVMVARLSATTLDAVIFHAQDMLTSLARQPALSNPQASPADRQAVLSQMYILGHGVVMLDSFKHAISATSTLPDQGHLEPVAWSEVSAVSQALAGKEFSLTILWLENPHVVMAVPVQDSSGATIGVLTTLIDLTSTQTFPFLENVQIGKTGVLDVIDAGGLILTSSDPRRIRNGHAKDTEEWQAVLSQLFAQDAPRAGTCLGCDISNPDEVSGEVIAFAPLTRAPWGVVVRQSSADAFASARMLMLYNLLLGAITVVGALLLVWVTTNSVIKPVQMLTQATRRISQGDWDASVAHTDEIQSASQESAQHWFTMALWNWPSRGSHKATLEKENRTEDASAIENTAATGNEIGMLAESFDAMRQRLKQSIEETNALNRELDLRVQERTQQAVAAQIEAQAARDNLQSVVETLERRNQYLAILNAVAATVNLSLGLDAILDRALEEVLRLTTVDAGAIFFDRAAAPAPISPDELSPAEAQTSMQLLACRGLSPDTAQLVARLGMLDGSCGGVMEKGEIVVIPDISRYRGTRARTLKKENLSTLVHVPIASRGAVLGSMCVATYTQRSYDLEEQALLLAIASQIGVAIENARLYAEVQHKEQVRGELFRKAITAQEEERKRIARELHDVTSQNLTALIFASETIASLTDKEHTRQRIEDMHKLAQQTLDGVHKLIFDLRPSMLDHLGLVPALRWFSESRLGPKGMHIEVEQHCPDGHTQCRLPAEVETAIFRIVQEAILNIARHSGARNVSLQFYFKEDHVEIYIEDDGIGFDPEHVAASPDSWSGLGLLGMQERLELLHGALDIHSMPGSGTRLIILVPVISLIYEDIEQEAPPSDMPGADKPEESEYIKAEAMLNG